METKLEQIAAKAVKQRPKSVVREIRTPRSVVTRWAPSNGCPYRNRKLGLRRGRRLALHLGSLNAPAARPRLERDQAAPGFGEEGEHCRRVIKRRATASKARPELGALLRCRHLRLCRWERANAREDGGQAGGRISEPWISSGIERET